MNVVARSIFQELRNIAVETVLLRNIAEEAICWLVIISEG